MISVRQFVVGFFTFLAFVFIFAAMTAPPADGAKSVAVEERGESPWRLSIFCDSDRGNLVYIYDRTADSALAVVPNGCPKEAK